MTWGEGAITRVKAMPKKELETRLLDAWEAMRFSTYHKGLRTIQKHHGALLPEGDKG